MYCSLFLLSRLGMSVTTQGGSDDNSLRATDDCLPVLDDR